MALICAHLSAECACRCCPAPQCRAECGQSHTKVSPVTAEPQGRQGQGNLSLLELDESSSIQKLISFFLGWPLSESTSFLLPIFFHSSFPVLPSILFSFFLSTPHRCYIFTADLGRLYESFYRFKFYSTNKKLLSTYNKYVK